jgi:hypothetical protein
MLKNNVHYWRSGFTKPFLSWVFSGYYINLKLYYTRTCIYAILINLIYLYSNQKFLDFLFAKDKELLNLS